MITVLACCIVWLLMYQNGRFLTAALWHGATLEPASKHFVLSIPQWKYHHLNCKPTIDTIVLLLTLDITYNFSRFETDLLVLCSSFAVPLLSITHKKFWVALTI